MIKQRGFTLVEVIIALAFVMVFVQIIAVGFSGMSGKSTISWGINGMTEMRCIDGYKFVVGEQGQARQVLDEFGKGAKCTN